MSRKIRTLVIDDSTFNRKTIVSMLESSDEVEVISTASDGEEGLKKAFQLKPDVITLDLEMPKMDGFTFLRLLLSKQPCWVVIISSNSQKQNVFKALELGALDFIAKPSRHIDPDMKAIQEELLKKVLLVKQLKRSALRHGMVNEPARVGGQVSQKRRQRKTTGRSIRASRMKVAAIGASTGGPTALAKIFRELNGPPELAILVTVHMPAKFTKAFADRLNRVSKYRVEEAEQGKAVMPGLALVAPGGKHMKVTKDKPWPRVEILEHAPGAKYVPSVDVLFSSCAEVFGPNLTAVVLTGMGDDGRRGVEAVKAGGGRTIAESEDTAVVYGMPGEAVKSGAVDKTLPLYEIPSALDAMAGWKR